MSPLTAIATIHPAPGKLERAKELITAFASEVQRLEPGAMQFQLHQEDAGTPAGSSDNEEGASKLILTEL